MATKNRRANVPAERTFIEQTLTDAVNANCRVYRLEQRGEGTVLKLEYDQFEMEPPKLPFESLVEMMLRFGRRAAQNNRETKFEVRYTEDRRGQKCEVTLSGISKEEIERISSSLAREEDEAQMEEYGREHDRLLGKTFFWTGIATVGILMAVGAFFLGRML